MKILIIGLLVIINLIFSSSIAPYISIMEIVPNTSILILVSVSLIERKINGGILGLFIGLLQDIIFGSTIGINALVYFIIGYILTNSNIRISRDNLTTPLLFSIGMIILYNLLYFIILYFTGVEVSIIHYVRKKLVVELIYSAILMIPIYKGISKIFISPMIKFVRD